MLFLWENFNIFYKISKKKINNFAWVFDYYTCGSYLFFKYVDPTCKIIKISYEINQCHIKNWYIHIYFSFSLTLHARPTLYKNLHACENIVKKCKTINFFNENIKFYYSIKNYHLCINFFSFKILYTYLNNQTISLIFAEKNEKPLLDLLKTQKKIAVS